MEAFIGLLIMVFGVFVFVKSYEISEIMQKRNDSLKEDYKTQFQNVRGLKRLLIFLFINKGAYYETKTSSRNVLIFLSPFIILLGVLVFLMGLGVGW